MKLTDILTSLLLADITGASANGGSVYPNGAPSKLYSSSFGVAGQNETFDYVVCP